MWAEKPSKRRCGAVVSNVLTLDGSKLLPVCICFVNVYDVVMDLCCVAQAVALDLCRCLSGTC